MARTNVIRGALAGHAAVVGLLALCGTAAPVSLERGADGWWTLQPSLAWADRGRGGGNGGGGSGSDGGSGSSGGGDGGSGSGGGSSTAAVAGAVAAQALAAAATAAAESGSSGGQAPAAAVRTAAVRVRRGQRRGGGSGPGAVMTAVAFWLGPRERRFGGGSGTMIPGPSSGTDDSSSRDRPRAHVDLSERELESVLRGDRVLVDDRGRVLEVEIEIEHGIRTVTVKPHGGDFARNPGPIGNVHAIDAAQRPSRGVVVGPNGMEVEIEHGVVVAKPHGGAAQALPA